jgi:arginyl-tRNA synthetase
MAAVNIRFDTWFSQASIENSDVVAETIADLQQRGLVWDEDGALWLDTKRFGDPREKRVMRKSPDQGGDYTYLAGDIAYHRNKFVERGFDRVINVWGADHQGQVSSLLAGVEALGVERGRLEVRIGQMVSLAGGRIGKRLGNAVDLDDLVDDIGPDVMRLLSLVASIDQSPTIDLDKVRSESRESPVYYVQYAHARIASVLRKAGEERVASALAARGTRVELHPSERALVKKLLAFPEEVLEAADRRAPHRIATYALELAQVFTAFYRDCQVVGAEPEALEEWRLRLCVVSSRTIARALDLLGVGAPDEM